MKSIFIYLTAFLAITGNVIASVYYVSNAGSDSNDGLSKNSPIKTLTFAAGKVAPGDVILLRRGDIFRESVEIKAKNVEFNAYGPEDEALPVISGSMRITGFKPYKDGIYVADTDSTIGYLFVNNKLMIIARYPNEGWLRTKYWEDKKVPRDASAELLANPNTMIECPELTAYPDNADDFWCRANIRWRHHSWWFETRKVIGYESTGRLYLNDRSFENINPRKGVEKGWGFYLDNKLELLDAPGEWYYDKKNRRVYLYPPAGMKPDEAVIEGSVLSTGLIITDGVVQHIRFQHQKDIGLRIDGTSIVQYCEFEWIGRDAKVSERGAGGSAIYAAKNVRNARISHNTFRNNFNNGIAWWQDRNDTTASVIERNTLINTGVFEGYGGSGSWHAVAILIGTGRHVHVQYNRIERSGYVGILFGTDGNFAEYNIIKNAMSTLNDGGGIYTNCSRSIIRYNIILDTRGGMESSGSWANIAHGIWPEFLREYRESIIELNTIAGSGGDGIFLPNNFNCIVRNNVCYNNDRYQILMIGNEGRKQINLNQDHLIAGNVFYAASMSQNTFYFDQRVEYGIMKDNYFCKPSSDTLIHEGTNWPGMNPHKQFTLKEWKENFNWADSSPQTDYRKIPDADQDNSEIFINETEQTKTIWLDGKWRDLKGETITGSITLEPYTSQILIKY